MPLGSSKDDYFSCFPIPCKTGKKKEFCCNKTSLNKRYHFLSGTYVLYHCIPWDLETWVQKKSNFPVCAGVLNRFVSRLHKKSKILSFMYSYRIPTFLTVFLVLIFPRDYLGGTDRWFSQGNLIVLEGKASGFFFKSVNIFFHFFIYIYLLNDLGQN